VAVADGVVAGVGDAVPGVGGVVAVAGGGELGADAGGGELGAAGVVAVGGVGDTGG